MILYKESYIWVINFHLKSYFLFFCIISPGKEKLKTTYAGWHDSFSRSKDVSWWSPCCSAVALSLLTWPSGYTESIVSPSSSTTGLYLLQAKPILWQWHASGSSWIPANGEITVVELQQWCGMLSVIPFHWGKELLARSKAEFTVSRIGLLNSRCYWLLANHGCSAACRLMGVELQQVIEMDIRGQEWEGRWSWELDWNFW